MTGTLIDLQSPGFPGCDQVDLHGRQARGHPATGMVSVQLEGSLGDALLRLRAHAFATGTTIYDVAEHVVARRLRFD